MKKTRVRPVSGPKGGALAYTSSPGCPPPRLPPLGRPGTQGASSTMSMMAPALHPQSEAPAAAASTEAATRLQEQQARYKAVQEGRVPAQLPERQSAARRPDPVRPDEVFVRARDRLVMLWDRLSMDPAVREHFAAVAFAEVTAETVAMIHAEIQRALELLAAEAAVGKAITARELALAKLQSTAEIITTTAAEKLAAGPPPPLPPMPRRQKLLLQHEQAEADAAAPVWIDWQAERPLPVVSTAYDRMVKGGVTRLRRATFDVLEAVARWRRLLGYDAVFLWRGTSYLVKMGSDLLFLLGVPLVLARLPLSVVDNPLLDPARLDHEAAGPAAAQALAMAHRRHAPTVTGSNGLPLTPETFDSGLRMLLDEPTLLKAAREDRAPQEFPELETGDVDEVFMAGVYGHAVFDPALYGDGDEEDTGPAVAHVTDEQARVIERVMRIQRAVRAWLARRAIKKAARMHRAAVKIQCSWRRRVAAVAVVAKRCRHTAARRIQALQRGVAVRQRICFVRTRRAAATAIQRQWRGGLSRDAVDHHRELCRRVVLLQAVARRFIARLRYRRVTAQRRDGAARELQRMWKGAVLRDRTGWAFCRVRAAVAIQALVRGWAARRRTAPLFGIARAASRIQALFRGVAVRRRRVE